MVKKKKTVSASLVVHDIQIGISNAELMQKYQLSERELKKVFDKLFAAGRISLQVLDERKRDGVETPVELTHADLQQNEKPAEEQLPEPNAFDPVNTGPEAETITCLDKSEEPQRLEEEFVLSSQQRGQRESSARRFFGLAKRVAVIAIVFLLAGVMSGLSAKNDGANVPPRSWLTDLYQSVRTHPFLTSSAKIQTPEVSVQSETEEPLDYPVQRVSKDAKAKELLETMIKLEVLLEDAKPSDYCMTMEYFLRTSSPNLRLVLKNYLHEEHGCGILLEDMETLRHLLNDVVKHKLATQKSPSRLTSDEFPDKSFESTSLPSRSEKWLQGEAFLDRLRLVNKDTPACTNAVKGLLHFVNGTIDEAVRERDRYKARSFKDAASQMER
jgi:hypothetical protein